MKARLVFLFGLAVCLTSIAGIIINYSPVPFWDQWFGTVDWYIRAEKDWWPSFWSLHNEHRLLFSRLIFWPDMHWFGGVNILSLAANVVVCALLALSIYRAAVFRADTPQVKKSVIAGIALACCFSWMQSQNFTWGFQNQWFAVAMFALLSYHALSISAQNNHSRGWFALAILAALTSALSMANGNISWIVFGALMIYLRFPLRMVAMAALVAVVQVFLYFHHADGATGHLPHGTLSYVIQHDPLGLVKYTLAYLGSPVFYAFHKFTPATIAGLLVAFGTAAGVVVAYKNREMKAIPLLAFAVFLCITALATGIGRLTLGLDNVFQSRYATNALLTWAALLIFWILNAKSEVVRSWMYVGAVGTFLLIGICQVAALTPERDILFKRLVAGQAMREGVFDSQYLKNLWDAGDALKPIVGVAKAEQLSILAPAAKGYDNPPAHIVATSACLGNFDIIMPTETPGWSRAEGWVFDKDGVPKTIVITDAAGNTIGNGVVGGDRPDAAAAMKTSNSRLGWVAFYKTTSPALAFAKTGAGYCKVN